MKDQDYGNLEVHRLKARLPLSNGEVKLVQGVRDVFEILDSPESDTPTVEGGSSKLGKIVLIGRRLIDLPFDESFLSTISSQQLSYENLPPSP